MLVFRLLVPTWNADANYSFGWWIPFLALYLFFERWRERPAVFVVPSSSAESRRFPLAPVLVGWGLTFVFFRLALEADPFWRHGMWPMVGLYVGALLGWLWLCGGRAWMRHFAFPVCFLFLSLPWPFGLETTLIQGLMRMNTLLVAHTLNFSGISAVPLGNVIHLANCVVGVEEGCSGILSLQASIVVGLLLGELYHLRLRSRLGLLLLSVLFALVGNYGRTMFLSLLASHGGPASVQRWHDFATTSVLVFTVIATWVITLLLRTPESESVAAGEGEQSKSQIQSPSQSGGDTVLSPLSERVLVASPPSSAVSSTDTPQPAVAVSSSSSPIASPEDAAAAFPSWPSLQRALRLALGIVIVALLAEALTQGWFLWRDSHLGPRERWSVKLPRPASFQTLPIADVTRKLLNYDQAETGTWRDRHGWEWVAMWFLYEPKYSNSLNLQVHNPDQCLPAVGLTKEADYPRFTARAHGIELNVEPTQFSSRQGPFFIFWSVYVTSGTLFTIEKHSVASARDRVSKFELRLRNIWEGKRNLVSGETLEIAIAGPPTYEAAKEAYLAALPSLIVPQKPSSPVSPANAAPISP